MASFNTTSLPTDVQEVLINERDFLGEIVRSVLQEILELEITEHIGAEPHERTEKREGPGARPHGDVRTGVSTRRVAKITEELCGSSFGRSTVSALSGALDAEPAAWRNRPLSDTCYPYLVIDARYEKVRRAGRVVSQGVCSS